MKKNKSKGREYYIFAGEPGVKEMVEKSELELSPVYFMVIKEYSEIGKMIKREAKKRVNKIKGDKDIKQEVKE